MTREELEGLLKNDRGQALQRLPWWSEAEAALDDPAALVVVVLCQRQSGKTQWAVKETVRHLREVPHGHAVMLTASEGQAQQIYERKFRRPVERMLKALGVDKRAVIVTKRGLEFRDTESKLEVVPTSEATTPGRSVTWLVIDEARDVPDEVFAVVIPSILAAEGKIIVTSTAGRKRGFLYRLVTDPPPEARIIRVEGNQNPYADVRRTGLVSRLLSLVSPAYRLREIDNQFADDDVHALFPPPLIERAIDPELGELPGSAAPAFVGVDLARRKDLASLVVVVREPAQRPEARDHLRVAAIAVWDPKASSTGEVDFAQIRDALGELPRRFPKLERVLIDEGAEGGAVMPFARAHPALSLRVSGFQATVDSNMEIWSALAARLHARTISLPRHERLLAELVNLRQEEISLGAKWRVLDSSKRFHRDVAVALALAVHAAGEASPPAATVTYESMREKVGAAALRDPTAAGSGVFGNRPAALLGRLRREQYDLRGDGNDIGRGGRHFWR